MVLSQMPNQQIFFVQEGLIHSVPPLPPLLPWMFHIPQVHNPTIKWKITSLSNTNFFSCKQKKLPYFQGSLRTWYFFQIAHMENIVHVDYNNHFPSVIPHITRHNSCLRRNKIWDGNLLSSGTVVWSNNAITLTFLWNLMMLRKMCPIAQS